jgi:ammonium transporter, Amt family
VVGVHMVGGILGAVLTGVFASVAINAAGANGMLFGNPRQLIVQVIAVVASVLFSFVGSSILLKVTDMLVGVRVDNEAEQIGLDLAEREKSAYAFEAWRLLVRDRGARTFSKVGVRPSIACLASGS